MRTNSNLQEIKATLEGIRASDYKDISADVINSIVDVQYENQDKDNRTVGKSETHKVIRAFIEK